MLKTNPDTRKEFESDLAEFEERKRSEAVARSSKRPSKRIEAKHSTGFKMRMVMGFFWPLDILKREGKRIPKTLTSIKYNGKTFKGAVLDSSHGTPAGVIEMESYDEKGAQQVTCNGTSFSGDGVQTFRGFGSNWTGLTGGERDIGVRRYDQSMYVMYDCRTL